MQNILQQSTHVSQPTKISLEKVADNESCDKAKVEDRAQLEVVSADSAWILSLERADQIEN